MSQRVTLTLSGTQNKSQIYVRRYDLTKLVSLVKNRPISGDPVDDYLTKTSVRSRESHQNESSDTSSSESSSEDEETYEEKHEHDNGICCNANCTKNNLAHNQKKRKLEENSKFPMKRRKYSKDSSGKKIKGCRNQDEKVEDSLPRAVIHTCDVKLRVRAEYVRHDDDLHNHIHSNKQHRKEKQFELFSQASTILRTRDLGSIVCDIKFSEITYLDAFWRDYANGALLEALKSVFISEALKEEIGHNAIRLLVSVDEEDYEKGRNTLMKNLTSEL
ncbi:death effector domain-containing protein-like [Anneissia japonica]|uniref:death effector domain-containing protein-like n=1 Tax=Anneissia japonica TaxID=1529436 RepID=UPI0014259F62|nr:death effector domain-containing protein-like [Anneissia japonica]